MVEEHIGRLLKQVKQQVEQIRLLQTEVDDLKQAQQEGKETSEALQDCLEASGALRRGQLAAQLHRRRFEGLLRRTDCAWDLLFTDVVHAPGVLHPILRFAGLASMTRVSTCSTDMKKACAISHRFAARPYRVYIFGGSSTGHTPLASAMKYDLQTGSWQNLPDMPTPRDVLAAVGLNGKLFTVGGTDGTRPFHACEVFDTEDGQWSCLPAMPTARAGIGAAVIDRKLYVVGGSDGSQTLGKVERLDVRTEQWQQGPSLRIPRRGLSVVAIGKHLFAISGSDGETTISSVERLDTDSGNTWEEIAPLPTPRRATAAAELLGKLYVVGGAEDSLGASLTTVERFDPEIGVWETLPDMQYPRRGAALLAAEGRLLVFGGSDGTQAQDTVEEFNPQRMTWEIMPPMPCRRGYFGAAVLQTAEVLGLTVGPAAAREMRSALSPKNRGMYRSLSPVH